jgi:hypothetical protein
VHPKNGKQHMYEQASSSLHAVLIAALCCFVLGALPSGMVSVVVPDMHVFCGRRLGGRQISKLGIQQCSVSRQACWSCLVCMM